MVVHIVLNTQRDMARLAGVSQRVVPRMWKRY